LLGIGHLYHLALTEDWETAPEKDYETSTLGVSLSDQGFIHCSFRHQVQQIADVVYRGRDDVLLLKIDADRVAARVKVEALREGEDAFPHIYGPLNRQAVVTMSRLRQLADGRLDVRAAL
jgi:glutathione S-transferase